MEVKLDKQYPLAVDAGRAWTILKDLKSVAGCMPGAEITEQLSQGSYRGGVKVKVGPAVAQFGGTVDVLSLQPEQRRIELRGKGADKAGSSASMDLIATIVADPADPALSNLHGEATVIVNGRFAQFGGRIMVQVSDMILGQFVDNFRAAAAALPTSAGAASAEASAVAAAGVEIAAVAPAAAPTPAPRVARELNGLAIAWMLIKNWWLGLFGKRGG